MKVSRASLWPSRQAMIPPEILPSLLNTLKTERRLEPFRRTMKKKKVHRNQRASVIKLLKEEISLAYKIRRLQTMQKLFKYWHVAHLPFALIMLIVLIIHVAVTLIVWI